MKNILGPHFGDCNPYHLAKLMFCTITKLYTFCYTFPPPVPVNYEKEVNTDKCKRNYFFVWINYRPVWDLEDFWSVWYL